MELTEAQKDTLAFIRDFTKDRGYPPSVRDIQHGCGLSSTSVAAYRLKSLLLADLITTEAGRARSTVLTKKGAKIA